MAITRSDRFTGTKQDLIYSDFLNDLTPHPVTGDVVRYGNEHAVSRAIRNIVLTNKGERLYTPKVGSNIRKLLFEPMSDATAFSLSSLIRETIHTHEPRAMALKVDVIPNYDRNAYTVNVNYMLINIPDPISLSIALNRVR